ncbi:transcriptional regulator opi1, partial [Coemansia aciculifera]
AIPIVNSALGIYDRSRQSSALLRAGTSVIESGVRKMCQPITKRIGVAQLDSFACRQLDNLGYSEVTAGGGESSSGLGHPMANLRKRTKDQAEDPAAGAQPSSSSATTTEAYDNGKGKASERSSSDASGRWRVGSLVASARDRAVAYREDSVRRLRYCLEWVAYATALLQQHIDELKRLLAALQDAARVAFARGAAASPSSHAYTPIPLLEQSQQQQPEVLGPADAAERLHRARREIVGAVRKAVGVVSHYAGSVLPGEARRQVRDLILNLPGRWAAVDTSSGGTSAAGSCSPSIASVGGGSPGPMSPPSHSRHASDATLSSSPAHIDANVRRTLAFATESFYMLNNVRAVFQNLYTNAERWIGAGAPAVQAAAEAAENGGGSAFTAYRDPPPGFDEFSAKTWQNPRGDLRRRLPHAATGTAAGDMVNNSQSLADIGERMQRMDVEEEGMNDDDHDAILFKRNRTREPTPDVFAR